MKKYTNQIFELYCNCCGKKIKTQGDRVMEGVFPVQTQWGYFSDKDGEIHEFDLCEACYDKWISGFQIPVEKKIENELL